MKKYTIQLQYGEHTFKRVLAERSIRAALMNTMIFIKQELYMRDIGHIQVSRPTKMTVKVEN